MPSRGWRAGRRTLNTLVCGLVLAVSAGATAQPGGGTTDRASDQAIARAIGRWDRHIAEASARFGVPEEWIRRVMRIESGGRTILNGGPVTSRAGAMGLMQLMPGTWAEMRALNGLGPDPNDPRDNILAGAAYLRAMVDRFGYPGAFAAYNAGPARYAAFLSGARALPAETRAYVAAVAPVKQRRSTMPSPPSAGLFAIRPAGPSASLEPSGQSPAGLFVALSSPPKR